MSTWMALNFRLKPGSEDEVAEIFATSGRPEHTVLDENGKEVGRLLQTMVFVGKELAVRVIEIDGDMMTVSRHMAEQEEVKDVEAKLEQHLAVPRDMTSPEGAMKFFAEAGMRCVLNRHADDEVA